MTPEFVHAMPALLFFWEDFSKRVEKDSLPPLWKILLQTRTKIQHRISILNEEQRQRLELADAVVRTKLAGLLQREGCFDQYCRLRALHNTDGWWYFLE